MTRFLFAPLFALAIAQPSFAQDVPLSQILIDGEGWKKVDAPGAKPDPVPHRVLPCVPALVYIASAVSSDRETMFVAPVSGNAVWAYPLSGLRGAEYCPLRLKRGEKEIAITGLVIDRDGRIYAATEIGVQVFDPTGRLCGVLTPAAEGKPVHLAFEGDTLTHWIGSTKYARKLNTTEAK